MTYQITCFSPEGHARKLAQAYRELLPPDTRVAQLHEAGELDADVQMVGFDLQIAELDALPENLKAFLGRLSGKTAFLFATVPFRPNDVLKSHVHNSVAAALPHDCDYRGMYLCPGEPPEMLLDGFRGIVGNKPDNTRAKYWLARCELAKGRPSEADIQEGMAFASHVLKLNKDNS